MNEKRAFIFAQLGVMCALALALLLLPGAPPTRTLFLLASVWAISRVAYFAISSAGRDIGLWTLLASFALLSLGLIANVSYFTLRCGATSTAPLLLNNDASVAWQVMECILDGGSPDSSITVESRFGYGRFLALAALVVGRDVAALLTVNVLFVLLTIVLAGRIASLVAPAGLERRMSSVTMIMIASVCYFLSSGVILIKDACCCFIMALSLCSMLEFRRSSAMRVSLLSACAFLSAAFLAALVRPSLLLFMLMGLSALMAWRTRRGLCAGVSAAVLLTCIYCYVVLYTNTTFSPEVALSQRDDMALQTAEGYSDRMYAYTSVAGVYYLYSPFERLLRLPMSLAVQFLTPFPWGFMKHVDFGYSLVYSHIAWPWYAVGGLAVFYFLFGMRRSPRLLCRLSLLGAAMTVSVAFIYGGLVSRYCLPWLPAIVPAAAMTWLSWRRDRKFKIYAVVYVSLLAAALLVCHHILTSAAAADGTTAI